MIERETMPPEIKKAYEEYPIRWYEAKSVVGLYGRAVFLAILSSRVYDYFTEDKAMYTRLVALIAYTIGALADNYSTIRGLRASEELQGKGVESGFRETNPITGPAKTPREFMRSRGHLGAETLGFSVAVLLPEIGAGWAASRGFATIHNMRSTQRLENALEIVKEKQSMTATEQVSQDLRG